jgi:hypothetical protein
MSAQELAATRITAEQVWVLSGTEVTNKLDPKEAFILGFVNGKAYGFDQLGVYDED